MRDIWVISDTHFGHTNIIDYCGRPFDNVEDMNDYMVDRWNEVVKPQDIVYHLGDVYMGCANAWLYPLSVLHGRKRLILGNHDDAKDRDLQLAFQKILGWRMFPEFGLLLTHVPVHESALGVEPGRPLLNVHGHIHERPAPSEKHINVSVEQTGYAPVNIDTLRVFR